MKRINFSILIVLALALLVSAYSRTTQSGAVKKVAVTAKTLASQPVGKSYVLDLTRAGTVYDVAADVASRVQLRLATGMVTVSALTRAMSITGSQFLVGTTSDLNSSGFPGGGFVPDPGTPVSEAKKNSNGTMAACKGPANGKDCKDMQKAWCDGRAFACGKLGDGWGKGYGGQQGCACTTSKY